MNFHLKTFCFVLAVIMILSFVGCDKSDNPSSTIDASSNNNSSNESSVTESNTSSKDDTSSNTNSEYMNHLGSLKPLDPGSQEQEEPSRYEPSFNDDNINNNYSSSENSSSSNNYNPENNQNSEDNTDSSDSQNTQPNIQHSSVVPNGYKYVWGDEFDGTTLNKNKWSDKYTKMTGANVLLVESTPETISVKDGALILRAYKDKSGVYHVPSSVHTQSTMNYQYGYMEMRAKLSLEVGSFASFWTRSISDNPKAAVAPSMQLDHFFEVDMFEVFQKNGNQRIGGNILINSTIKSKNWYPTAMPYTQQLIISDENFHIFGYEWTPTEIKLYFDNKMYARFDMSAPWVGTRTNGKGISGWDQELRPDNTGTNLISFQEHQYLIFNHHLHIAVNDGKGGTTGFLASTSVTENKNFKKADYVIDYVRLYQKSGQKLYTIEGE